MTVSSKGGEESCTAHRATREQVRLVDDVVYSWSNIYDVSH